MVVIIRSSTGAKRRSVSNRQYSTAASHHQQLDYQRGSFDPCPFVRPSVRPPCAPSTTAAVAAGGGCDAAMSERNSWRQDDCRPRLHRVSLLKRLAAKTASRFPFPRLQRRTIKVPLPKYRNSSIEIQRSFFFLGIFFFYFTFSIPPCSQRPCHARRGRRM